MKTIINSVLLCIVVGSTLVGCDINNNLESETPKVEEGIDIRKNPVGAIGKAIKLSKNVKNIPQEIANKEPVPPVSFKELINFLPQPPAEWSAEKPQGQTNSFGNYSISQVNQTYTQGDKQIEISIFDWAFNSALYTPFLLTTEFSQESTEGYNKGLKIDGIPGREEYTYANQQGSLNLLVNSRFLVQIEGSNIEDLELRKWWQRIDYQSLTKIDK
ncbi:MAG: hypothetical protein AAGA16_19430 [Cyanobacteria bacterium P01_E01_bin.35]